MSILVSFWQVLAAMAPWLLGGFLLAGVVSVFLPREWVVKVMGGSRGWRGILNAVLIGVPLPICSCGVLPLSAGLRKAGAGKGAMAGFLISTPQTGIDSICATYALMGPVFAVARPLAAFATGLVGGAAVQMMTTDEPMASVEEEGKPHCCCCCCHAKPAEKKSEIVPMHPTGLTMVRQVFVNAYVELLGEIVSPLIIGLVISAAVAVFVPDGFFADVFGGNDWLAMPAMIILGFPMYVCSTASIPIAASLVMKGLTPGAAFVFLMVGPAINAASLATISSLIGRSATVVYALVIAFGAILCGVIVNCLPFEVLPHIQSCCAHETTWLVEHVCGGILVALIVGTLFRKILSHKQDCCCSEQ